MGDGVCPCGKKTITTSCASLRSVLFYCETLEDLSADWPSLLSAVTCCMTDRARQDVHDGVRVGLSTTRTHAHTYARTNCDHQPSRFPASVTLMTQTVSAALCLPCTLGWSAWLISDAAACLRKSLIIAPLLLIKEEEVASLRNTLKTKRVKIDMCQMC